MRTTCLDHLTRDIWHWIIWLHWNGVCTCIWYPKDQWLLSECVTFHYTTLYISFCYGGDISHVYFINDFISKTHHPILQQWILIILKSGVLLFSTSFAFGHATDCSQLMYTETQFLIQVSLWTNIVWHKRIPQKRLRSIIHVKTEGLLT